MKYKPEIVAAYFQECGLPEPVFEFVFHPHRKWRFDLAFPENKIYCEVDGGIWVQGAHNRGAQMIKNWEKRNAASVLGWRGIWVQPKDLCTLEMVELIRSCLASGVGAGKGPRGTADGPPEAYPEKRVDSVSADV